MWSRCLFFKETSGIDNTSLVTDDAQYATNSSKTLLPDTTDDSATQNQSTESTATSVYLTKKIYRRESVYVKTCKNIFLEDV